MLKEAGEFVWAPTGGQGGGPLSTQPAGSCTGFCLWRKQAIRRMSGGGAIPDAVWILRVHEDELESQLHSVGRRWFELEYLRNSQEPTGLPRCGVHRDGKCPDEIPSVWLRQLDR